MKIGKEEKKDEKKKKNDEKGGWKRRTWRKEGRKARSRSIEMWRKR